MAILFNFRCSGEIHEIILTDEGDLVLIDHPNIEEEKALVELGGLKPECFEFIEMWNKAIPLSSGAGLYYNERDIAIVHGPFLDVVQMADLANKAAEHVFWIYDDAVALIKHTFGVGDASDVKKILVLSRKILRGKATPSEIMEAQVIATRISEFIKQSGNKAPQRFFDVVCVIYYAYLAAYWVQSDRETYGDGIIGTQTPEVIDWLMKTLARARHARKMEARNEVLHREASERLTNQEAKLAGDKAALDEHQWQIEQFFSILDQHGGLVE